MIAAYAPGSVSNVACGFDVLGFAMDEPGDIVSAGQKDDPGVRIDAIHGDGGRLPLIRPGTPPEPPRLPCCSGSRRRAAWR